MLELGVCDFDGEPGYEVLECLELARVIRIEEEECPILIDSAFDGIGYIAIHNLVHVVIVY